MPLEDFRTRYAPLVDQALTRQLSRVEVDSLREAMAHLTGRGKLLRPMLALAAYQAISGADPTPWVVCATSLELVHVFSLIHDDLPALDDARMRRGRGAVHLQYGEALAVLAGDGLMALALDLPLNEPAPLDAEQRLAWLGVVSSAIHEMIEGEILDLQAENHDPEPSELRRIHELKTGALLGACCRSAAVWAGVDKRIGAEMQHLGIALGLAFQIRDDLLGVAVTEAEAGKTLSSDQERGKATYPRLLGVAGAKSALADARQRAKELISDLELRDQRLLLEFADWIAGESG